MKNILRRENLPEYKKKFYLQVQSLFESNQRIIDEMTKYGYKHPIKIFQVQSKENIKVVKAREQIKVHSMQMDNSNSLKTKYEKKRLGTLDFGHIAQRTDKFKSLHLDSATAARG